MVNSKYAIRAAGTRCLAPTQKKTWVYTLANSQDFPIFKTIPGQRQSFEGSSNYKDLKKSILRYHKVFVPIVVTPDGYLTDGFHRTKIVKELWNSGIDVEITVMEQEVPEESKIEVMSDLQKGKAWDGEDFIYSQAQRGNKPAQYILEVANRKVDFNLRGIFGIRSAIVCTYGGMPKDYIMPEDLDPQIVLQTEKLFSEITTLLTIGNSKKTHIKQNNWTQSFINAWRRIRTNDIKTQKEDEEGVKITIDTKALNNMIDEIGIEIIGEVWPAYAAETFSTSRLGKWVGMFERMILQLYASRDKFEK